MTETYHCKGCDEKFTSDDPQILVGTAQINGDTLFEDYFTLCPTCARICKDEGTYSFLKSLSCGTFSDQYLKD